MFAKLWFDHVHVFLGMFVIDSFVAGDTNGDASIEPGMRKKEILYVFHKSSRKYSSYT